MNFEYELDFLTDFLNKCHIRSAILSANDTTDLMIDSRLNNILGTQPDPNMTISRIFGSIENKTKYRFINELKFRYLFMRLPIPDDRNILFIGPYLSSPLSSNEVFEIGERLGLPANSQNTLREYCISLPIISENDRLFALIDIFCERIWQTPSFSIVELNENHTLAVSSVDSASHGVDFDEVIANMEIMEMRYAFENELIQAVALGQQHKEKLLASAFSDQMFEKRLQDPVRNAKNYCIIMNTLLRKAAEQGGVHPMYIDRVSSRLATKIELTNNTKTVSDLMREIFSSYCRLVRNHSTRQYSSVVKKAILMIDSDISAELSLRTLAEKQSISPGYLATIFKKETGKTVSEYIRNKRINHAIHLLNTTNLLIQTIAMHCGIMDVQYFSKIFKKQIGKTPKEYRDSLRH